MTDRTRDTTDRTRVGKMIFCLISDKTTAISDRIANSFNISTDCAIKC